MVIYFITGSMKSGKSKLLIERLCKETREVLILKPKLDTRDGDSIKSRGTVVQFQAFAVDENNMMHRSLLYSSLASYDVVYIDEVHFFSEGWLEEFLGYCYELGINIVASGLLYDYKQEYFNTTKMLKSVANNFVFLKAKCDYCKYNEAIHTVLEDLESGMLITKGNQILVDGSSKDCEYKASCIPCKFERTLK